MVPLTLHHSSPPPLPSLGTVIITLHSQRIWCWESLETALAWWPTWTAGHVRKYMTVQSASDVVMVTEHDEKNGSILSPGPFPAFQYWKKKLKTRLRGNGTGDKTKTLEIIWYHFLEVCLDLVLSGEQSYLSLVEVTLIWHPSPLLVDGTDGHRPPTLQNWKISTLIATYTYR